MTFTRAASWRTLTVGDAIAAHRCHFKTSVFQAASQIIAFRAEKGLQDDDVSIPTSEFVDYRNRALFGHDWLLSYREQRMRIGGFV